MKNKRRDNNALTSSPVLCHIYISWNCSESKRKGSRHAEWAWILPLGNERWKDAHISTSTVIEHGDRYHFTNAFSSSFGDLENPSETSQRICTIKDRENLLSILSDAWEPCFLELGTGICVDRCPRWKENGNCLEGLQMFTKMELLVFLFAIQCYNFFIIVWYFFVIFFPVLRWLGYSEVGLLFAS